MERACRRGLFHLLVWSVAGGYIIGGAFLFRCIERYGERETYRRSHQLSEIIEDIREIIIQTVIVYCKENAGVVGYPDGPNRVKNFMDLYQFAMYYTLNETVQTWYPYKGKEVMDKDGWSIGSSILFSSTIVSTVVFQLIFIIMLSQLFFILPLFHLAQSDFTTRLNLKSQALDIYLCPSLSKTLNTRLTISATSVLSWHGVVDESVDKVKIGIPSGNIHCQYKLLPSQNAIRLLLNWPAIGSSSKDVGVEVALDIGWKNGHIITHCNATHISDSNSKLKAPIDIDQSKEGLCDELKQYFSIMPSMVVYPVWTDLDLIYSVKSITVASDSVDMLLSTSIGPLGSDLHSYPAPSTPVHNKKMIEIAFDRNLITEIFERIYSKYGDHSYRLNDENECQLKSDCANSTRNEGTTKNCLGLLMKSIMPQQVQNRHLQIDIILSSIPTFTIENGTPIVRVNGKIDILSSMVDQKINTTLVNSNFRLVSRLIATGTEANRITGSTSLNDIALMMSEFKLSDMPETNGAFNDTTREISRLIAPVLVNVINSAMGVGLPLPFPQSVKLNGMTIEYSENSVIVESDVTEL